MGAVENKVWGMDRRLAEDWNVKIKKEYGSRKEWGDDSLYFFEFLCAMRLKYFGLYFLREAMESQC